MKGSQKLIIGIILGNAFSLYAEHIALQQQSFDQFLKDIVILEDRDSFRHYYDVFLHNQKNAKTTAQLQEKRHNDIENIAENGYNFLKIKQPDWAFSLKSYYQKQCGSGIQQKSLKTFLVRYGIYQEFLKDKVRNKDTMWAKMRSYATTMRTRVSSWFTQWKKPKSYA